MAGSRMKVRERASGKQSASWIAREREVVRKEVLMRCRGEEAVWLMNG